MPFNEQYTVIAVVGQIEPLELELRAKAVNHATHEDTIPFPSIHVTTSPSSMTLVANNLAINVGYGCISQLLFKQPPKFSFVTRSNKRCHPALMLKFESIEAYMLVKPASIEQHSYYVGASPPLFADYPANLPWRHPLHDHRVIIE
jgi:hypothetical protein